MKRYNSSIRQITGECIDCQDGVDRPLISGRCSSHYKVHRLAVNRDRNSARGLIQKPSNIVRPEKDEDLENWFSEKIAILSKNPVCWECAQPIPDFLYRFAVAHIFPKAKFKSVQTANLNYLFLGSSCGCHERSHRLDTFSRMKVWPEATRRFITFESDIKESHKYLHLFKSYMI